jgi:flagellar protein FlbD
MCGLLRALKHLNTMVQLTRLNHETFLLNCDLIEQIEITPDTVITLTNSHRLLVLETAEEVVRRVQEFRRSVYGGASFPQLKQTGGSTQ